MHHWLLYSLDEKIKISDLKKDTIDHTAYDSTALEKRLAQKEIHYKIIWEDAHFKFSTIVSKPYIIYYQWDISLLDQPLFAVVWPRKASSYAKQVMEDVFEKARLYNLVTISWWAPWVDTICHKLSMKHGIPTIVVLWGWFAHYLRSSRRWFLEEVVKKWGLVISEFKIKQEPTMWSFPQRNRIVAGLSETVFLPAAGEKSWSLITVDFALQMHKIVSTVPNSIYEETSLGTNRYISEGRIKSVSDFSNIFDAFFTKRETWQELSISYADLSEPQQKILTSLKKSESLSPYELTHQTWLSSSELLSELMLLEFDWFIKETTPGVRKMK